MSLEKHYVMRSLVSWVMWWGALKSIMWWWALKSIMWRGALWVELCDEEPCELSYVMRSLVSWVMWWGALKSIMWWWALKSSGALLRKAAVIYTEKQRCLTQESSSDLHRKAAVLYTGKQQWSTQKSSGALHRKAAVIYTEPYLRSLFNKGTQAYAALESVRALEPLLPIGSEAAQPDAVVKSAY